MKVLSISFLFAIVSLLWVDRAAGFTRLPSKPRLMSTTSRFMAPPASKSGIRVRLLTDVKGTGKKGEIVFVSPALWTNVLGPKKNAEKVTDEEISNAQKAAAKLSAEEIANAQDLADKIKALSSKHEIKRKVGANRQLFGSVSQKQIIEAVRELFPNNFAASTPGNSISVLIADIKPIPDSTADAASIGGELVNGEIRKSGIYKAILKLHPKIEAEFTFAVVSEGK